MFFGIKSLLSPSKLIRYIVSCTHNLGFSNMKLSKCNQKQSNFTIHKLTITVKQCVHTVRFVPY